MQASTVVLSASTWGAGDLDGDGGAELIAVIGTGIAVIGELGTSIRVTPLGAASGSSAIADLDGDGTVDIVMPQSRGLVVAFGGSSELLPTAYAPFTTMAAALWVAGVRLPGVAPEHGLLSIAGASTAAVARATRIPDAEHNSGDWLIDIPGAELGEHVAVLDVDAPSDSDEIVIAGGGVARVLSMAPDVFDPSRLGVYASPIALPGAATGGALVADRDGDGDLDILIRIGDRVAVAYDIGDVLAPAVVDTAFETLAEPGAALPGLVETLQTWPLAAGDLDGDGRSDFISPNGVFHAMQDGALLAIAPRTTPIPWHDAVIVDLDGDGRNDIVAADIGSLIVLRNTSSSGVPAFAQQILAVPCMPSRLRALQFDGLAGGDVVYRARGIGCPRPHLGALYGGPGPYATKAVIALDVDRFEPARFRDSRGAFDATDDLVAVVAHDPQRPVRSIAFISGEVDRQPLAPLTLSPARGRVDVAEAVVAGRFARFDIAAFVGAPVPRLYLAASDPAVVSSPRMHAFSALGLTDVDPRCMRWIAGDRDGDGIDELVGLPLACAVQPRAVAISVATEVPRITTWSQPIVRDAMMADLDGDGGLELITVGATSQVLWSRSTAVTELPRATAVAVLQADRDPARELAVLVDDRLLVLDLDDQRVTVIASHPIVASEARLVLADLDRDGIEDLVIARHDRADIYRGLSATEAAR